jgi:hypothetical protein
MNENKINTKENGRNLSIFGCAFGLLCFLGTMSNIVDGMNLLMLLMFVCWGLFAILLSANALIVRKRIDYGEDSRMRIMTTVLSIAGIALSVIGLLLLSSVFF